MKTNHCKLCKCLCEDVQVFCGGACSAMWEGGIRLPSDMPEKLMASRISRRMGFGEDAALKLVREVMALDTARMDRWFWSLMGDWDPYAKG